MTDEADPIVVGSSINGLVAAAELARAGWSVILLERDAKIGGFIAAEERTLPGYLHDTFSSWHPLFVSGPAYAALGELLHRHGLEYRNTDGWVTASVADDGRATFATGPRTHGGGVRPCRGQIRLSRHAATAGREHGVNRRPAGQRGALPRAGAARERSGPQRRAARRRVVAARSGHQRPGVPAPGLPRAGSRPPVRAMAAACWALSGPR